jgi:hypothetical protein
MLTGHMRKQPIDGPIQPKPSATKEHIANLARALNTFVPVLVNESGQDVWKGEYRVKDGVDPAKSPNFQQLINTAFGAIGEIMQFIQEHDVQKKQLQVLTVDLQDSYQVAHRAGVHCPSMLDSVVQLVNRRNQAIDILHKLANADEKDRPRIEKAARHYLEGLVPAQNAGNTATANGLTDEIKTILDFKKATDDPPAEESGQGSN